MTASVLAVLSLMNCTTRSKNNANNSEDIGHPWRTPIIVVKSLVPPATCPYVFVYIRLIVSTMSELML